MKELLDTLLQDARVWQARHHTPASGHMELTGHAPLDHQLKGIGWPIGALTECFLEAAGIGELQLLLPLIRRQSKKDKFVFWLNPPHTPYAPALAREGVQLSQIVTLQTQRTADTLWALENCLRSPATGLVMAWCGYLQPRDIRKLQLAAEAGGGLCVLFRNPQAARNSSAAALRLELSPSRDRQLSIRILKCRGGGSVGDCTLPLADRAPTQEASLNCVVKGPWPEPPIPKHAP
ncbi:translesion DNA synthesis-associated protein ImuA [Marinobacter caseinilyticus]|uniref:translesion DNA synthesis-associated protein ImuA n=1 Tax=Marinobacter caseinilyticus TaxID=2692195 RepID=UPI00140B81A4|nr:translesion DNA synthesis-associated protein ImuA [Marinobacter caseinilyticus]